jgi:hypothetical protein
VADLAMGEPSDRIFDEMTPIVPLTERAARIAIDQLVLTAPGIQSVVLCNSMIYGSALGSPAQSVQIPALVRLAKVSGVARYIGRGLTRRNRQNNRGSARSWACTIHISRRGDRVLGPEPGGILPRLQQPRTRQDRG